MLQQVSKFHSIYKLIFNCIDKLYLPTNGRVASPFGTRELCCLGDGGASMCKHPLAYLLFMYINRGETRAILLGSGGEMSGGAVASSSVVVSVMFYGTNMRASGDAKRSNRLLSKAIETYVLPKILAERMFSMRTWPYLPVHDQNAILTFMFALFLPLSLCNGTSALTIPLIYGLFKTT